jgi:hypothetical protein
MPGEESVSHAMTVYLEWAVELPLSTLLGHTADAADRPLAATADIAMSTAWVSCPIADVGLNASWSKIVVA